MKVIFLDIDGVLNGYNKWTVCICKIGCAAHNINIKKLCRKFHNPFGIHERKVKLLSTIVKKTGAKIVLTSSWRFSVWKKDYNELNTQGKKLIDLFNKYDISIYDVTQKSLNEKRSDEIISWLSQNEKNIESYIILDDEISDLECFVSKELIQTSDIKPGEIIKGHAKENTGLKRKHVRKAIKVLNAKKTRKS